MAVTFVCVSVETQQETFHSNSVEQTAEIAASIAGRLVPGDVVLLSGELGSGKTAFVRAAAASLGVETNVTSPTFAIGNVYSASDFEIAHLDLYRLQSIELDDEAVLDDFLTPQRVAFVEWPHDELAETTRLRAVIEFAHGGEHERQINVFWREAS